MNREDIIRIARETGVEWLMHNQFYKDHLQRFAALVAAATAKEYEERLRFTQERWEIECKSQVEIEREACAKVCENMTLEWKDQPNIAQAELATLMDCALAIRARGQTK